MNYSDLVYIDSAGYHYPDYPTVLAWLTGKYESVVGTDVVLDPSTQDGQWIAIQAQAFYDVGVAGASVYNSFSPVTAQGAGLARVVKINGIFKQPATASTVDLVIVGVAGTTLTNSIAVDSFQNQWALPSPTTIPNSGTITVTATCTVQGAISAAANTITGIFTPTAGWQTVNNPAAATIGQPVQSDAQLRAEQKTATSLPAQTVFDATIAAVEAIPGVTSVRGYENATGTTDGNGLPPHSISIVSSGGDSTAIATAIQIKKTPGTQTYGTTSIPLTDSKGVPIIIHFYEATPATINVQVTITPLVGYTSDFATLIQNAMALAVTSPMVGATGIIGGTIQINQLYGPAYLPGTAAAGTYTISSIEISKNSDPVSTSDLTLDFNEIPVCTASTDVTVVT